MPTKTWMMVGVLALSGCYEAGRGGGDGETGSTGMEQTVTTVGDETPSTSITQGSSPTATEPDPSTSMDPDSSSGTPVDPGEYAFDDAPPEEFVQVDRMGMPAVNTALISAKDAYNAASPFDDDASMFVDDILGNLTGIHAALDDDLMGAGLVPCDAALCFAQVGQLIIPDAIELAIGDTPGFPNGRLPTDTALDVTLAVILLDLTAADQDTTTLVGTNPTANDKPFMDDFPYFAEPH